MNQAFKVLLLAACGFSLAGESLGQFGGDTFSAGAGPRPSARQLPAGSAAEHSRRGVQLARRGLWSAAAGEHEVAFRKAPDNEVYRKNLSETLLKFAAMLAKKRQYEAAVKKLHLALFADPGNSLVDQRLDQYLRYLGKDPDSLKVRFYMAEDADASCDYETAIVEHRRCVKMSDSGISHARLGRVLLKAGNVAGGYDELRAAVAKPWGTKEKRELGECHQQLGDVLKEQYYITRKQGHLPESMLLLKNAGTEYRRAVETIPNDVDAARGLIEVSREAVTLSPSAKNYLMLGGGYLLVGDFPHAKQTYEKYYALFPPSETAVAQTHVAYLQALARSPLASAGDVEQGIAEAERFSEREPTNARWLYILGRLKENRGESAAALEDYRKAEKIDPTIDPDLTSAIKRTSRSTAKAIGAQPSPGKGQPANSAGPSVPTEVEYGPYLADVQRSIKRAWFPPAKGGPKQVVVVFKIHSDGILSELKIEKTSGLALADIAALKAVESAAPFRALPQGSPEELDIQTTFHYYIYGGMVRSIILTLKH